MHKAGFVNIIGNPNVGKSTLMNALVGERLSIITSKAQTTRHRIMGIVNGDDFQIVYTDTPGIVNPHYKLHEQMMGFVHNALEDADLFLLVTEVGETLKNQDLLAKIIHSNTPIILVINKIDLSEQQRVNEKMAYWHNQIPRAVIIPASATERFNLNAIFDNILQLPDFSQGFLETAFRIFEIPDDIPAYSQRVVWLGHVSGNPEKKAGTIKMTEVFKKYKDDVIARIHPREKELELYEGLATDTDGYMWELQLSKTSMEGRLLVTLGSTGVFTPKLLYNSEPRLLFMYKLIPLPNGSALDEFLQIVSQLKESYAHPEHIYEPETWEEFEKFIQEYLDETSPGTLK